MPPSRPRSAPRRAPQRPARTRVGGAMKKTTAAGAYKKSSKKFMMRRRLPFVETKSRTAEEMAIQVADEAVLADPVNFQDVPNDDAITQMPLDSFNWMTQGLGEDQMIGLNVFSKYIKQKLQFKLPTGANAINFPCNLYLIHGWLRNPYARTSNTSPTAQSATYVQYNTDITQQLKEFFDEREDKLRFIPKTNNQIKILGYKKLKPNRNHSISPPTQVYTQASVPAGFNIAGAESIINVSLTWKVMRKVNYTPGVELTNKLGYFYNNAGWRPFTVLFNPEFAQWTTYPTTGAIQVASNNCHWYSDS
jgi:hypothetical protein